MAEPLAVVRAFHAAFEERDEERFAALVAEDVEILNPLGNVVARGREGALEWLRENAKEGVHVTPSAASEVRGQVVTWPVTMRIGAAGTELAAVGVFHVRDDLIARFEPNIAW